MLDGDNAGAVGANANAGMMECPVRIGNLDHDHDLTSQSAGLYLPDLSARCPVRCTAVQLTKGMAAAQLRLLRIFAL
jgi:hypothetical protein